MALVLAAHQCAGVGVDVNHLAVAPDAGVLLVGLIDAADRVAGGSERVEDRKREGLLDLEDVREILVVEARSVRRLLHIEAVVQDGDDVVGDRSNDGGAAGRAEDEQHSAALQHDGGRHVGERALAGGDGVGRALDEAVHVGRAGLGGEVVHLVVEQEAERAGRDTGAEEAVERGCACDGVALGIDDGEVRGLGGFVRRSTRSSGGGGRKPAGRVSVADGDGAIGRMDLRQAAA